MSRSPLTRRALLGRGLGAALLLGCRAGAGPADARPAPAPTPAVFDDDDDDPGDSPGPVAACVPTADNIEGPFFKPGAPHRAVLAGARDRGQPLALAGRVLGAGCAPLAGALLEVWHADHRGAYDLAGFRYRGTLRTDEAGRWTVRTIVPGRYRDGRRYRPMHVHVKLRAPHHRGLTTQLYFAGDPYHDGDPFLVPSLIMAHRTEGGVTRARFDFVLAGA
jgi:protocatechuate 3,4-dioxygenase beta subunit